MSDQFRKLNFIMASHFNVPIRYLYNNEIIKNHKWDLK